MTSIERARTNAAARVAYHGRWWVHVPAAFTLGHHNRALLGTTLRLGTMIDRKSRVC